jgi:hypothetical protein
MAAPAGILPGAPEGSMAFRARQRPLFMPELEQLLRISPPVNALQTASDGIVTGLRSIAHAVNFDQKGVQGR